METPETPGNNFIKTPTCFSLWPSPRSLQNTKQFVFLLWSHFSEGENFFYLMNTRLRAFLYILQKICLEHPPGRLTVSGIGNATERISGFVEFHINNLNQVLFSASKNSHLLTLIIMCTLDIESLYTNTDHEPGLESLEHFLHTRSTKSPSNMMNFYFERDPLPIYWSLQNFLN